MIKLNAVIKWKTANTMGLAVVCPFCNKIHHHGSGGQFKPGTNGYRVPDCFDYPEEYMLNITETALEDAKDLFRDHVVREKAITRDEKIRDAFERYNDEEPDKEIFGAPVLNAVIKERGKNNKLYGLLVICPFCGDKHSHGDEITKPGMYGLRVAHCGNVLTGDYKKDRIDSIIKSGFQIRDSYWLNVTDKAFEQAKFLKKRETLYFKEHKVRLLFGMMNDYKPRHFDVAKFRYDLIKKLPNIDCKSQYLDARKITKEKHPRIYIDRSVYFIACEELGVVKIGMSNNPKKRLNSLQTGFPFPLTMLKTIGGGEREESQLHHKFAHLRKSGEWFDYSMEIKFYLNTL